MEKPLCPSYPLGGETGGVSGMRVCAIAILGDFVVIEREERVLKAFSGKNVCGRGPCYRSPPGNCT